MAKTGRKEHKKKTMTFLELWDEILTANIKRNDSNYGETRTYNSYVDMLGVYSGEDNVTYVYSIDGYPNELEVSFRTTLRRACHSGVRISFISQMRKHTIDWSSARMKARMRAWRTLDEEGNDVDEFNLYENLSSMDAKNWRKDSLVYLSTAEIRRKRKMYQLRSLMLVSGIRGDDFNKSIEEVTKLCKTMGIKLTRVIGDIPKYLEYFSPFSCTADPDTEKLCGCVTVPDELLSRFNTYSQGMIGKSGIYWGTDIYSCFPCLKPVKRTTETAENWLITAETGGGKSFFVKGLLVQLLAKSTFNGTIMDVEGFEYMPMANYLSNNDLVVILNMAEGSGAYYDPVEIIVTGDPDLDSDMYSLSVSFTLSLFKCLLGTTQDDDEWIDIVINDAVSLMYGRHGIDAADPSTWYKSSDCTLFDVYDTLKSLKSDPNVERAVNSMFSTSLYEEKLGVGTALAQNDVNRLITSNEGYQQAIDMCIAKVSRYFEPNGVRASLFTNRITIDKIRDAKLVICSFGMAGKSPSTVDPIQMALMQLYSANISHLRSVFSKMAGKFNFKLWEEFQRWGGFPDADKTINVALTGGRKLGDVNIIVTNNVKAMLDDDKFGVFSNITSIAIGCIWDATVRKNLCKRLSIESMESELDTLVTKNKDISDFVEGDTLLGNAYSKAFLIGLDKTVYTLARMTLPRGLANSLIFRTGVNLKGDSEEDSGS